LVISTIATAAAAAAAAAEVEANCVSRQRMKTDGVAGVQCLSTAIVFQ